MASYQPGEPGGVAPSRSNGFLYFAVGALFVAVAALGYLYYQNQNQPESAAETAVERSADAIGDAADEISDSVRDAARSTPPPADPAPAPPTPGIPPS